MSKDKKQQIPKNKKTNDFYNKEISSLDIDKREYQDIVLSNSNFPERDYFKQNYYD